MTFEQICPKWDKALYPGIGKRELNKMIPELCDWRNCVVGEAYGKSDGYVNSNTRCQECYTYSVKFYTEAANDKEYDRHFEPIKKDFAEHFNKVHGSMIF